MQQSILQQLPGGGKSMGGGNPNSPDAYRPSEYDEDYKLEQRLSSELRRAQDDADQFTKNDQQIKRKDTVEVVLDILNRIKAVAEEVNKMSQENREKLYHISFNSTVLIFRLTRILREASFSKEATTFLAFNVLCLDNNLILTTAKYLDWRVMNYIELARAYADLQAYKAAGRVVTYGVQKVLYLKQIEEQDPPVPDGTKETLVEALRVLRTQELKYQLQSGALTPDAWKKKVEETFAQNKYHRALCIVECLNCNDPMNCRLVQRSAKNITVKAQALKLSLDLVKTDIELIKQALIQIHEKMKRDREKKELLAGREANPDLNVDEILEKFKVLDQEMIKERDWKFASQTVPIEVHVELLKLCFECKMWPEFDMLLDPALIRLKFRRYEVPYLATVDVLMSANRTANIPNGFEKITKDLNAANLKIELKKLRQQAKLAGADQPTKKEEGKKEEKKAPAQQPPPAQAKPDPKAAAAGKGGKPDPKAPQQQQQQEIPKDEEDEQHIQASEAELERIKHVYVNLLLQRTKNSQNAIVGVDVMLGDENVGPDLPDNHFAVAIPIRQHHGVYEKTKLIPYVVFRRTANGLIDEDDCLSIVTDVQVIMGQDAHLRAPLGYHKIPIDLRQTPRDLERVPNLDYVFLCYKTDKALALTERDLLLFRRLAELEKSYLEKAQAAQQTDEYKAFLNINYNMEMLVDLARTVKEALLGPLGDFYLEHRQDVLFDLSCLMWSKYMLPILQRMDLYTEMRHQREYPVDFIANMDELIIQVKNNFAEAFNIMHRILTRMNFVEDMIMYSKFSIYLASIQEELGEFRNSVQTLRSALGKITEYREERLKQSLDSKENIRTSMSITIDNKKIGDIETKIQAVYEAWEQMILRKERDRVRRENEEEPLEEDEGDEEQAEVQRCIDELKNKDLFEKGINYEEWRKTMRQRNQLSDIKYYNEQEQIIHSLHCDLLINLYRCEIKLGKEMQVVKTQTSKLLQTQGVDLSKHAPGNLTKNLSSSLQQKMNQTKTNKTLSKAKQDLSTLKQTLQEAGKLPPPKPQIQSYEKLLEKENNHNCYQNALLQMSLAVAKTNIVEQKSLLLEAIEYLKKAKAQEDHLASLAVENAIYIKAAAHYHQYFNKSADQVHPFHLMAQQQYIKKTGIPTRPIFICRTSTSVMMKLPFYKPVTEYKSWKNIGQMALYGKPSGSGVGVSLNNTEYDGTGEKRPPGDIVRVTGLVPNEKYVFAAGGYTVDGICVNGIGETSTEIVSLLPLSLHQLYGYLAEIAYKLGHYQIAKQAAETLCSQFIEKNDTLKYSFLDARVNPILAFRLNTQYLSLISPIEAKQLAEAFLILARVSKVVKTDTQKRAETHELKVEKQKIDMKICNYLLVALDISLNINSPVMTKRIVADIFNHLIPYFEMNLRPHLLFQVLFKCHQAVTKNVPAELVDSNLRRVIGCLSYQLLRLGFENAEDESVKRVMLSELPANTRKWRKYFQYQVKRPELTEEQRLKKDEQDRKIAAGEYIAETELIKEPEPYEEKIAKVEEFEQEGGSLEEFLLSLIDYQDIVKAKAERWKLQINRFQKLNGNNDIVDKLKEELTQVVDFWEGIKLNNPAQQLQQILTAFDATNPNPKYLEFCCKCVRRSMELGLQTFAELEDLLANKIKMGSQAVEELVSVVETKITERLEYLEKDIVRKQRRRFNILEEKVQQLQEQKSISGGNLTMNVEKLMESLKGQVDGADLKEEDYFGLLPFDSETDEKFGTYNYLWISEKLLLQGMCAFLSLSSSMPQRNQLHLLNTSSGASCVFNDILQLDFSKSKQALDEQNDRQKSMMMSFYEENKGDQEAKFAPKIEDRVQKMTAFLKIMSRAAEYAKQARGWLQLENVIRYTWNAFNYDLTTPLELKDTEAWKYVVQLAECSLVLMEHLKGNGGRLRKNNQKDIDEVRNQKPTLYAGGKTVAFNIHQDEEEGQGMMKRSDSKETLGTARSTSTSQGGSGNKNMKWFERIADEFEVSIHASFIGFSVQCLMGVKQWESLVDISNRLNDVTINHYASQLLPFIIFAQTTLYQEAAGRTYEKKNELQSRIQAFENWKLTNKKKRSRQAMITGEIPPEEQEFLKDKAQLEKEIFRLEIIEAVLNSDRLTSEALLESIKRDANACEESLKQCRKLYFQYGVETQNLRIEEQRKGQQHYEIKTKRKGHKVYSSMVISNYKKCVDLLRKRQEKFLLIQALHELGNLLYADGQLGEAEIQWNDCIDTIFQKLYVLNAFRSVLKENPQLADSFGSRQCLIGGVVLTKLGKLCYEGRDMHRFNECLLFASELFAAPARLSLPHPQTCIEYNQYRIREFLNDQLFVDQYIITPSELLHTLAVTAQSLQDADLPEKSIPLSSLMEYLAFDITKSKLLTVKARVLKALALIEIGYINEAYQLYNRILSLKDLPKQGQPRESEYTQKKEGKNYYFPYQQRYHNNLAPEHEKNQEAIQNILKPLPNEILTNLKKFCSPYVVELLQYLRCALLLRIGESENVELPQEKQELRLNLLKTSEDGLRNGVLKAMQANEEIGYLREKIETLSLKQIDIPEVEISDIKARLGKCYEQYAISEEDQKNFYSNKEEEMCYADRRSQFLNMILRARLLIARIQSKQGLLLNSFYILRQALTNFKAFAEGKHSKVETGLEAEEKGSFKLPEIYGGSGLGLAAPVDPKAGAKGGAPAQKPPPVDPKKPAAAGAKGAQAQAQTAADEEEQKKQEEERRKREAEEEAKERIRIEAADKRDHPHMHLWLKIKLEIVSILYHQRRFEDCSDAIAITKLEAHSINDLIFTRQLMEIEFMMDVYRGELESALRIAEKIKKHASAYYQNDVSFAIFLGNLSEFMYNKDKRYECADAAKEGRTIMWLKLKDYGIDLDPQNINFKTDVKVNKSRSKPDESVLAQFQSAPAQQPPGKGGAAQKGAPAGKPGAPAPGGKGQPVAQVPDDLPTEEDKQDSALDFTQKVQYPLIPSDPAINSSYQEPNIYLRHLEQTVRFDVRYAQYLTMLTPKQGAEPPKHELSRKILLDTEKLMKRTLHISPSLKFYVNYILGWVNLKLFFEKVQEFQSKYSKNPKYKESLTKHIPYGSIALGQFMIELPNFSEALKTQFKDYLDWSKKYLKAAVDIGRQEPLVQEFDFTIVDALRELSECSFLIMEYRQRCLGYKYAKYKDLDMARKLAGKLQQKKDEQLSHDDNLALQEEIKQSKDEWEEHKMHKEKVDVANAKRWAVYYLDACIQASRALREFQDKQHILSSTQAALADNATKLPREVASEMFETAQVTKVNYSKIPDFDPKDKTAITPAEILAYLKALAKELEFMTFGEEKQRQSKLLSKLHRYLKINLAQSYGAKCALDASTLAKAEGPEEFKDISGVTATESNVEGFMQRAKIVGKWLDFKGHKSAFFYIIGPSDEGVLNALLPPPSSDPSLAEDDAKRRDELRKENMQILMGQIEVDPLVLSALYQEVRDLGDKMKASEKNGSTAQNERDRKGYRIKFNQLLERFGTMFKPPAMAEIEDNLDALLSGETVMDLFTNDGNTLLPDLTHENVDKLAQLLQKDSGCMFQDPKLSMIIRRFHRLRYVQ